MEEKLHRTAVALACVLLLGFCGSALAAGTGDAGPAPTGEGSSAPSAEPVAAPGPPSFETLMVEAERLWDADDYDGSDRGIEEALKLYPDRAEPYWRKARNIFDRLEGIPRDKKPPKEELIRRYREIEQLAQKCSALEPANGVCTLWKAIGMGRRGTTQGVFNSLTEMKDLEKTLLKTLDLEPTYRSRDGKSSTMADTYAVLGQFYRVVPDWWILSVTFGSRGDMAKSVEMNRKAVELESKRIEHAKELGVSLICYGEKEEKPESTEEGKRILESVQSLPVLKPSDAIDKEHAKMLLADPSLACAYSRDAQQEVSKEAFDKNQKGK